MVTSPMAQPRRRPRQQLVLRVEFDDAPGFRSHYLSELDDGGVWISKSMDIGQRLMLQVTFHGAPGPLLIEALVKWSLPSTHAEGPASGLAFVEPSQEATEWLAEVLEGSTQPFIVPELTDRVILLEVQPFLREIYGQEVRNWAELRDAEPVEIVAVDDVDRWLLEISRAPATLAIVDLDGLAISGLELYQRVRGRAAGTDLPLIALGSPERVEPLAGVADESVLCLRKPLRFGVLMNTVRVLAREAAPCQVGLLGR